MPKKIFALAIAGLASTAAFAQSNVTIYGVADASMDFTNIGDTTTTSGKRVTKISSNQSRLGFKGTEDLGNGLKAVFQIETAYNVDASTTGGTLNSRNTFVGLQGDSWGRIVFGQHDSPYKTATRGWDSFGDHLGDNRNIVAQGFISFDDRPANTVRYDSPDMNGFQFAAAYVAGAEAATTSGPTKGNEWTLSGTYKVGAWTGALAYAKHDFGSAGSGTLAAPATFGFVGTGIVPAPAANDSEKAWKLGVAYKEGPVRLGVVYEDARFDLAAVDSGRKAWTIDGGYTFGSNEFVLAYTHANDLDNTSSTGAKQWAIGLNHMTSKRTKLYAAYVKLTNDTNARYSLTGAGGNTTGGTTAAATNADPSAFQFGIKHTF